MGNVFSHVSGRVTNGSTGVFEFYTPGKKDNERNNSAPQGVA
jgi:hypothetical protein